MSLGLVLPVVLAALVHGSPSVAGASQNLPPTLAILDFDVTPGGRTLPPPHLGATAAQLMLDRLVSSGRYRVLDARWLRPRPPHEARVSGELLANAQSAGVDYLLLGSVTRFSTEDQTRTIGGLGVRLPFIGGFQRRKTEMAVSIVVTVVEVGTGVVVTTTTGDGMSARKRGHFGAISPFGVGGVSSAVSDFYDALLDDATRKAVGAASDGVVNAAARLRRDRPSLQ
jgi:curli biogenesis system outer membrane secretion channel CsgG